jgi:2-iminobutanoate/2-iminopropanoate deaminase
MVGWAKIIEKFMANFSNVRTNLAPLPVGPYSQAIVTPQLVFLSGQIAIDPSTGQLIAGDISAQTEQVFRNIGAVLEACGLDWRRVVKTTVFLTQMADFAPMNAIYAQYFPPENCPPARSCVAVFQLPLGALVEIECIAIP